MTAESFLHQRKRRVGIAAALSLIAGGAGLWFADETSFWPAALVRVGIVLGALWLTVSASPGRFGWQKLSREKLGLIILIAAFFRWIKVLIPALLVIAILIWVVRPKARR